MTLSYLSVSLIPLANHPGNLLPYIFRYYLAELLRHRSIRFVIVSRMVAVSRMGTCSFNKFLSTSCMLARGITRGANSSTTVGDSSSNFQQAFASSLTAKNLIGMIPDNFCKMCNHHRCWINRISRSLGILFYCAGYPLGGQTRCRDPTSSFPLSAW